MGYQGKVSPQETQLMVRSEEPCPQTCLPRKIALPPKVVTKCTSRNRFFSGNTCNTYVLLVNLYARTFPDLDKKIKVFFKTKIALL